MDQSRHFIHFANLQLGRRHLHLVGVGLVVLLRSGGVIVGSGSVLFERALGERT